MTMAVVLAGTLCALSLAIGLIVRRAAAGWLRPPPRAADESAGPLVIPAARRWSPLIRALVRPDAGVAALAVWLSFLDAVLALAAPWPLQVVVDYAVGHRPLPPSLALLRGWHPAAIALAAASAGLLLLLAGAVTGYLVTFLTAGVSERMTARLRMTLAARIMRAEPPAVAAFPLGELTSRLGGDTVRVSSTIAAIVETLIPEAALLAGMAVITAALDWRLTVVAAAVIPMYAVTARVRNRGLRGAQRDARSRSGDLAALTADLLTRLPAVHVFDRAADEARRYGDASTRAAAAEVAAVDASARFAPVTDTLPGLALAAALVTGTVEVTSGRLTLGGFLVFLAYLSSLTGPVKSLARLSATVTRGTASRDRIAELLRLPVLDTALCSAPAAGRTPGPVVARAGRPGRGPAVALDRVSYAHRPGRPVLTQASLHVPGGTLLALTGPSGGGKSTLLSLLVRLAHPQSGTVTIDGRDIAGIPLAQLRELVTLVPQDAWLHTGTIEQNIRYGHPEATPAQVRTAAERAGVTAFAASLPDGYQTPVGEHGHQLSGGQQRRVAVARALLRDAPVLLLDEPTTGLDPAAESRLVTELLDVTRGKTVILISHQPALIARAEHVVHLEGGRITQAQTSPLSVRTRNASRLPRPRPRASANHSPATESTAAKAAGLSPA